MLDIMNLDIEKLLMQTDMIAFLEDATCRKSSSIFGAGESPEEKKVFEEIEEVLFNVRGGETEAYLELGEVLDELSQTSETEGFRRGFCVALRMMISGLNTGNSN